jgi:tetratricopeptide (TPR) repeat protein
LPAPLGLPAPIKPAPELLGEVLVAAGRPAEAVPLFEQALRRNPNRSLSVLGLARASAAAGNADAARRQYTALLANFDNADADLPQLQEARAAVASNAASQVLPARLEAARYGWMIAAAALAGITVVIYVRSKTRKRGKRTRGLPRKRENTKRT